MSLADQSQQWFPTNVQVTVHQARNLRAKGKNGTNDSYAIIQVAKDKFSTSVSEKSVDPVWKEEASFDLPLFHQSNSDRCTLYVIVMHRAQVGLDKFLGQAVVKLLDLHDNRSSKKTDWFKLVDKSGKEDKARGEVLLDIQFMRNNMSASMNDLSMQDKPRSRMSKFKDKVRGKKKDGFSDSSSAVVSSVGTVLTDSDVDADAQSLSQTDGVKKKSKLKTLFAPKSNLQRNISQSMSTLGTLPARNSSISSSRSSGLNVDSTEVKKKFKFRGHKRTESSDSKVSLGPLSLLGRSKQSSSDLNSMCVNGSHVYAEEKDPKSGSTLSLNSSGSVEDVHKFREVCVDSFVSVPVPSLKLDSADGAILEQQRHQEEEEERRQMEEKRLAETKRMEEEVKLRLEARRLQEEEEQRHQEEQERKRRFLEEEARREEERRKQEESAESQRLEEQRRQEEASMSDRLTSLFGILRKKEEKKEELPSAEDPIQTTSHHSSNPFEDIPLSSDSPAGSNESPADPQTFSSNPQTPTSTVFLNRNAKVSAVKPRFTQSLESEPADTPSHSESTLSSVPSESPDTFSRLHSLLDPRQSLSPSGSPSGSTEDLTSAGSSPTMADKRRRTPTPPSYTAPGGNSARESRHHAETDGPQPGRKISLPLPDYDTLYPQKRHGVQGETRWDHIIAEVNQKHRDYAEMSVDGPEEHRSSFRSSILQESPAERYYNTQTQVNKPVSSKKVAAPAPPKSAPAPLRSESSAAHHHEDTARESLSVTSREALRPSPAGTPAPRPASQVDLVTAERDTVNRYAPTAKPRLRTSSPEPVEQEDTAVTSDIHMNSHIQTYRPHTISRDTNSQKAKESFDFDPFPSNDLLSKDPWDADDLITRSVQKEQKVEDRGMTPDDLDQIFGQEKQTDPFADFNGRDSNKDGDSSPGYQRRNSQRRKQIPASTARSDLSSTTSRPRQEYNEETSTTSADQVLSARSVRNESTPKPPANTTTQSQSYEGEDQFAAQPFPSSLNLSERLEVVLEEVEPAPQPGGLSGGKAPLRAWVSPSDVQRVSAQSSNGDLAFTSRRPHPVKPMNSDSQYPVSSPAVKDTKVWDSSAGKLQVADPVGSGPFTQLTQEELITLVVRQQADLSKKDSKITELEEYIDNLLVRVIDEQPDILQALNFTKPV